MDIHTHACDCGPENRCDFCGCCHHCDDTCRHLCKVTSAPVGMRCPETYCGCEGTS